MPNLCYLFDGILPSVDLFRVSVRSIEPVGNICCRDFILQHYKKIEAFKTTSLIARRSPSLVPIDHRHVGVGDVENLYRIENKEAKP